MRRRREVCQRARDQLTQLGCSLVVAWRLYYERLFYRSKSHGHSSHNKPMQEK